MQRIGNWAKGMGQWAMGKGQWVSEKQEGEGEKGSVSALGGSRRDARRAASVQGGSAPLRFADL
ncbi:hypothetical protein [Fischerella sp. PCC 9605]|uniref:hypothetical protein n=1 Tax=Fischerella sp. PCC 9605 TaxID=1173024 RepID=UPI0012DFC413|nr:hypothetical protein [Fischerella sp. PCC 9605]